MFKKVGRVLALCITLSSVIPYSALATNEYERLQGSNRYETGIKVSQYVDKKSDKVIVTSGQSFADSLSGTNLVNEWNAPLLLTETNKLPENVVKEIKRLGASEIYIIGGESVISKNVENQLANYGRVKRIAGSNRYETSQKVFNLLSGKKVGVATGMNFPDALASIPFLRQNDAVLLLVNPKRNNNDIKADYVFGGMDVVPGFAGVKRFDGKNRYETAKLIADETKNNGYAVVSGLNFPDALTSTYLAKNQNLSILLANDTIKLSKNKKIFVVGGSDVVSDKVIKQMLGIYVEHKEEESGVGSVKPFKTKPDSLSYNSYSELLKKGIGNMSKNNLWINENAKLTELDEVLLYNNGLRVVTPYYYEYYEGMENYLPAYLQFVHSEIEFNAEEYQKTNEFYKKIANLPQIKSGRTDVDKVIRAIHYFRTNYRYPGHDPSNFKYTNVNSYRRNGQASCQGASMGMFKILSYLNIPSYVVKTSMYDPNDHTSIRAFVDGSWHSFEVTTHIDNSYVPDLDGFRESDMDRYKTTTKELQSLGREGIGYIQIKPNIERQLEKMSGRSLSMEY